MLSTESARAIMLTGEDLLNHLARSAGARTLDRGQRAAVLAPAGAGVRILAGPGTGKTTCIAARILKLVLVDGVPPAGIVALTFTRKAAAEMRSRVLGDGYAVIEAARDDQTTSSEARAFLDALDLCELQVGTIDSFCARWARDGADPDNPFVASIDEVGARMVMEGVIRDLRATRPGWPDLVRILHAIDMPYRHISWFEHNLAAQATALHTLWRRRLHDRVHDWSGFVRDPGIDETARRARLEIDAAHREFVRRLREVGVLDNAMVQEQARRHLTASRPEGAGGKSILHEVRALFVDEYHDTDLLHQAIYFALGEAPGCRGAITIVGDDDQAIYRFRGATVDLLATFPDAYAAAFGRQAMTFQLDVTYRSTPVITEFVARFAGLDEAYQSVRTLGSKRLVPGRMDSEGAPVFGLFRRTLPELSRDVAALVRGLVRNGTYATPAGCLEAGPERSPGDVALIFRSPRERDRSGRRLPDYVREGLANDPDPILTWNPRGTSARDQRGTALVGGLVLRCLDPDGEAVRAASSRLADEARSTMDAWRGALARHLDGRDATTSGRAHAFIRAWDAGKHPDGRDRLPKASAAAFLLDLAGALPDDVIDSPEFSIGFGLFLKQAETCRWLYRDAAEVFAASTAASIRHDGAVQMILGLLGPVADGRRRVEDDGPDPLPRDRVPILSIHQSKGLEFPVVIVDAGCFSSERMFEQVRMPIDGAPEHRYEAMLRPFTPLGDGPPRSVRDLACDDLIRGHFVAYSRARDVLVLAGLDPCAPGASSPAVPNLATGWTRDRDRPWARENPMVLL